MKIQRLFPVKTRGSNCQMIEWQEEKHGVETRFGGRFVLTAGREKEKIATQNREAHLRGSARCNSRS